MPLPPPPPHRQSIEDDEALARQLQQQFASEFRQSQQNTHQTGVRQQGTTRTESRGGNSLGESARRVLGVSVRNSRTTAATSRPQTSSGSTSSSFPPPFAPPPPTQPNSSSTIESDEEYARRLEKSFREEEEQRRLARGQHQRSVTDPDGHRLPAANNNNNNDVTFPTSFGVPFPDSDGDETALYAQQLERAMQQEELGNSSHHSRRLRSNGLNNSSSHGGVRPVSMPPPTSSSADDEQYARRLQREIQMEQLAQSLSTGTRPSTTGRISSSNTVKRNGIATPITADCDDISAISMVSDMTTDDDLELARRVEQELRDEELARRLSTADQERISASRARQLQASSAAVVPSSRPGCTARRVCSYLIPSIVIIGIAVGLTLYFTNGSQFDFIPTPEDFRNEDPFNAKNPDEVEKWRTQGDVGLELEIIAALESSWLTYFDTAVSDWDNGSPDSLTLTKSYTSHETACDPINFKLKVCNGNYGNTKWRGINKILLADGYIFASTAKMNEYYFTGASDSDAQRQYTMCHEIGHGFGLTHTDESFTNADLGNCLDYTNNPQNNLKPDESNYKFLEQLYGNVPGSVNSSTAIKNEDVEATSSPSGGDNNGRRRRMVVVDDRPIPNWVLDRWHEMERELENHSHGSERRAAGWRLLHETDYGEVHETDIGGGYSIQVHKLLHRS